MNSNNTNNRSKQLEKRTIDFSVAVISTFGEYSSSSKFRSITDQLIRSATSIGANYAEANNSSSRADFKNKIYIAKKEAGETRYWLSIFSEIIHDRDFSKLTQEATELNLILQKIITTMRSSEENGK